LGIVVERLFLAKAKNMTAPLSIAFLEKLRDYLGEGYSIKIDGTLAVVSFSVVKEGDKLYIYLTEDDKSILTDERGRTRVWASVAGLSDAFDLEEIPALEAAHPELAPLSALLDALKKSVEALLAARGA
jgi:hypothetical protein